MRIRLRTHRHEARREAVAHRVRHDARGLRDGDAARVLRQRRVDHLREAAISEMRKR